jgi:hypothetical protein
MMRRRSAFVLATAACASAAACYGPTEVRLEISTDLPCRAAGGGAADPVHTLVRLGDAVDSPIVADTTTCSARAVGEVVSDIGSIVLVPSGDRAAHVTVQVTATADGSDPDVCGRPGASVAAQAQCIVARRTFAFIKHTSRSLPIRLYASCKGQVCDATQTCNGSGTCESSVVDDDTGCLASEPGCNGAGRPVAPPVDAGASDGGDAMVVDASDAAVHVPCTSANGTNVITTGTATDRVAANSTQLFWIGDGITASDTTIPVMVVDTQSPGPPAVLFTLVPTPGSTVTALAADDRAVWIGTETNAYRYDLQTKALLKYAVSGIMDIASSTARDAAGVIVTTKAYAVTVAIVPGNGAPSGAVYELRDDGFDAVYQRVGTRVAATNRSAPTLFVFTPMLYKGPTIARGFPNAAQFEMFAADDSVVALATDDHDLFYATSKAIGRLDATAGSAPTHMFTVDQGGRVAVDPTDVFFEQKGADSAIFRAVKNPLTGGIFTPGPQRVATGYGNVAGLTLDSACVYFWSTPPNGGTSTLSVYPKTRSVLPSPVANAIKAPHTP